jgi:hypothetical protein
MPIKLLTARLAKPWVADSEVHCLVSMAELRRGADNTVFPGETQVFHITVLLPFVPSDQRKWPTTVEIIVIDQFANEYRLPRIKLRLAGAPPMTIRVPVDTAECFRRQINWDADTVELEIGSADLTEEERKWITPMHQLILRLRQGLSKIDSLNARKDRLAAAVRLSCHCLELVGRIHPYANGNGHMARFASWAIVGRYGFWPNPNRWPVEPRPCEPYVELIKQFRDGNRAPLEHFMLNMLIQSN